MKKIIIAIATVLTFNTAIKADEGMWIPALIGQSTYNDMVKRGLKLTKEQIYSMNKSSIKDAIIIFGNGCTGEIVSAEGLIFTNHHCGYDAIASASTVEKNYLQNGFWAKSKPEEIPSKNLTVQFLSKIEDVSKQVFDAIGSLTGKEKDAKIAEVIKEIESKNSDNNNAFVRASVRDIFKGGQYLLFVYKIYKDVRFVGTPPESIGKFGGDTDNWEWPRHTGDFSVFRVYMGKDGKPAEYATDNLPYKANTFLPISLKGVKEGDYAMTLGYPGSTNRFETSYGIDVASKISDPALVELREKRLALMMEEMKKSPATRLKLASSYAGIANYWKFFKYEGLQLIKRNVAAQKRTEESKFITWAKGKPEYENLFNEYESIYKTWTPNVKLSTYLREGILGSPLAAFANNIANLETVLAGGDQEKIKTAIERVKTARKRFIEGEDPASDEKILAATLQMFFMNVDNKQHPTGFFEKLANNYGDITDESTFKKYAKDIFANTSLINDSKFESYISAISSSSLLNDPAVAYASSFSKHFNTNYQKAAADFSSKNYDLGKSYIKGLLEFNKSKIYYPDANFTMRLSYGNVKPYKARDAMNMDYICTLTGVVEKYVPGDYEFDLPKNLIEAYNKKDFGQYADPIRKDIVVGFLTTNDITGGNSGSPVINGKGELIGLAFDGNLEAISHKYTFDATVNRTICVDVRYLLWCMDKLGGATNLISELKLMK
jgi:hypothetical protein